MISVTETKIDISNYVFLGVLGCPWIGINHLSNIISSSKLIAPKVTTDDYDRYLHDHYNNVSVEVITNGRGANHIEPGFHNMGADDYSQAEQIIKNNTLTTVLADHIETGYWVMHNLKHLGKQAIVTVENYNSEMSISTHRNRLLAEDKPWQYNFLYDKDVVCRLFDLNADEVLAIDVAHFHSENIEPVISSLNYHFGLDLDQDLCQDFHAKWRKKIFDDKENNELSK